MQAILANLCLRVCYIVRFSCVDVVSLPRTKGMMFVVNGVGDFSDTIVGSFDAIYSENYTYPVLSTAS